MSKTEQNEVVNSAENVSRFFECEITLRVFGHVIWHVVFPAKSKS